MIKVISYYTFKRGESWSWSNGSWIYSYLCNQCPSPLSRSWWGAHDTALCDKVGQWLAAGLVFSGYSSFLHQSNWNIVESDVQHHNHTFKKLFPKKWDFYTSKTFLTIQCQIQCSLVKPPPSVQSVVWWYNKFGDKLRDIENRKLCDHMKR